MYKNYILEKTFKKFPYKLNFVGHYQVRLT